MDNLSTKILKRSQLMYMLEAALEYFIAILVSGSYLATLTKELGLSDSLTGLLSSIISLGCLFQLLSIFIRRTKLKPLVIVCSIINQALFMSLYLIPLTNFAKQVKVALFVVIIILAYVIYNIIHPKKIHWLMSLVDNGHRGRFTANKEILSLTAGILLSFVMSAVIDYFNENGQIRTAFILSAVVISIIMILHTLAMVFAEERELAQPHRQKLLQTIGELISNKNILRVCGVFILYNISNYASAPFYGTYQIGELGFSLKFVSAIAMCGSISRVLVSKRWGRYADKKSFAAMIEKCLIFRGVAQLFVVFTNPTTGKLTFILYYIFNGIAQGGINSALINLIYDYVPLEKRADSLAITQAVAGLVGFLTTLCISPLVSHIQRCGISLFEMSIYAQQVVSLLALLFTILTIFYIRFTLIRRKKK